MSEIKNPEIVVVDSIAYDKFVINMINNNMWLLDLNDKIENDPSYIMEYFSLPQAYSNYIKTGKYNVKHSIAYNDTKNQVLGIKHVLTICLE